MLEIIDYIRLYWVILEYITYIYMYTYTLPPFGTQVFVFLLKLCLK